MEWEVEYTEEFASWPGATAVLRVGALTLTLLNSEHVVCRNRRPEGMVDCTHGSDAAHTG